MECSSHLYAILIGDVSETGVAGTASYRGRGAVDRWGGGAEVFQRFSEMCVEKFLVRNGQDSAEKC